MLFNTKYFNGNSWVKAKLVVSATGLNSEHIQAVSLYWIYNNALLDCW